MNPFTIRAAVAFVCLLLLGTARADKTVLVSPGEAIAGRTQAEWSVAWWQWARSFERDSSPVADRTGAMCGARQSGDVWFLAAQPPQRVYPSAANGYYVMLRPLPPEPGAKETS